MATKKSHALLTDFQAVQIFMLKSKNAQPKRKTSAAQIGLLFGVCEKTIRDIWSGRTWDQETRHLDPTRAIIEHKSPGRPRGSRDSTKRKAGYMQSLSCIGQKGGFESIDDDLFVWEVQSSFPLISPVVYLQDDDLQ
jgi:hypothetical protein